MDKRSAASNPLPPLAEQKRIVAKVDELMALCDRLEAQQNERETRHAALARASLARFADAPTPANLNFLFHDAYTIDPADLRKSILTLAVQGKLVPQDPNDERCTRPDDCAMKNRQRTIQSKNLRRKQLEQLRRSVCRADLPSSWCIERLLTSSILKTLSLTVSWFRGMRSQMASRLCERKTSGFSTIRQGPTRHRPRD